MNDESCSVFPVCQQWTLVVLGTSRTPVCSGFSVLDLLQRHSFFLFFFITLVLQLIIKLFGAIAINIHFPAEVFVLDLSSRFFLIRFCRAAPAVELGGGHHFCLAHLAPPTITIIRKNDTNVGSESTSVRRIGSKGSRRPASRSRTPTPPAHNQEP